MTRAELAAYALDQDLSELEIAIRVPWLFHKEGLTAPSVTDAIAFFNDQSISTPNRSRLSAHLSDDRRSIVDGKSRTIRLNARALASLDLEFGKYRSPDRPALTLINALRLHALQIENPQSRSFVEEALACAENGLHRAGHYIILVRSYFASPRLRIR